VALKSLNGAIGTGDTVFRTAVPATPGAQVGAIPTPIGAVPPGASVSEVFGASGSSGAVSKISAAVAARFF
jgi:hypothetical protein